MTIKLKQAIERVLEEGNCIPDIQDMLQDAYQEDREAMTETAKRVEFLNECLESGVSKREAARMLVAHDPRLSQKSAETLVYMSFSGQYRTTMRGTRLKHGFKEKPEFVPVANVEDDESLL